MRHRIKKTYSVQKDAACHTDDSIVSSKLCADKQQPNNNNKSHLLHSDKSILLQGGTHPSLLEACAHTSSFGRSGPLGQVLGRAKEVFAASERGMISSSKKVFTGAVHTYFYNKLGKLFGNDKDFFRQKQLANNSASNYGRGPRQMSISGMKATVGRIIPLSLPIVSSLVLLLILGGLVNPVGFDGSGDEKAYATEGVGEINEPVPYTVPPDDGVSLTLKEGQVPEDTGVIEEQVSGSGAKYITVDFTVGAHNVDDYKVYVQADSTTLTGSRYSDKINTVSGPTTAEQMNSATKQWGYAVVEGENANTNSMTFNTIQTGASVPAKTVTGQDGGKIVNHTQPYTLAFAANLDGAKADHYKSSITLSVAANAEETAMIGFAGRTYMQDVDKTFCDSASIPIGTEGRLIDKRDGKVYWVAKLKDGLCWMTQNLDLDISDEGLTASLSDMSKDWNSSNTAVIAPTKTVTSFPAGYFNSSDYKASSYDPGLNFISNGQTATKTDLWVFYEPESLIEEYDWKAVYDKWFIGDSAYIGADGKTVCSKEAGSKIGDLMSNDKTCRMYYYDYFEKFDYSLAHYIQGNYYSFVAATAGSSKGLGVNKSAPDSICAKGWKLPLGGGNDTIVADATLGSFGRMMYDEEIVSNTSLILDSPLYFLKAGSVFTAGNEYYAKVHDLGGNGHYRSSTKSNAGGNDYKRYSYFLSSANPSLGENLVDYTGASVRCVAR